jgi:signal transduction histidine kinase
VTGLRRTSRRQPGTALLVVLLLVMLGLSGVMAYQATDAAQSEMRSTQRALRGYASFAAWELARDADADVRAGLASTLARGLDAVRSGGGLEARADSSAELARFSDGARGELAAVCRCADAALGFASAQAIAGGSVVRTSDASPAVRAWMARELRRMLPLLSGVADTLPVAVAKTVEGADGQPVVQVGKVDGRAVAGVFGVLRSTGESGRVYGLVVDTRRFAAPVLEHVVRSTPLLPPSLRGRARNETALSVVVLAADGDTVLRSRAPAQPSQGGPWLDAKTGGADPAAGMGPEVADPLGGTLAGLTAHVALRPAMAGVVATEAAPRTRFALLLAIFVLTMCLAGVAIMQLQRQHELARLRDDFVSGVSHELRTPLAQIRLFADLLESGRLRPGEQGGRAVAIINEEARRLTYLVENVLLFARAQRRLTRIAPEPARMDALVREIAESFAPLARARDVDLWVNAETGVVAPVDRDAVRQVLLNLLDNAVKYGPRGQRVTVGVSLEGGGAARLRVDDQGPGIPPWERERVWEPYRRLEREAASAVGGCGIGLSVARELVELHGGRVRVEDAPGGGARFVVELPGASRAEPALASAAESVSVDGMEERDSAWIRDGRMAAP